MYRFMSARYGFCFCTAAVLMSFGDRHKLLNYLPFEGYSLCIIKPGEHSLIDVLPV